MGTPREVVSENTHKDHMRAHFIIHRQPDTSSSSRPASTRLTYDDPVRIDELKKDPQMTSRRQAELHGANRYGYG